MSEQWLHSPAAVPVPQPAADDAASGGTLLRRAREAAGLHVAALAVALKVPVRKLEALEEDRWDLLPDAVFARALASSVCRTLKIDPQPVLDRLPQTSKPRLVHDGEGINTPFRAPSDGAPPGWKDQLTRPVFLAVFALLLGALVIIFLPVAQQAGGVSAAALVDMRAPSPASPVMVPPREEQASGDAVASPAAASGSAPAAAMSAPAGGVVPVSTAPSPLAVPASAAAPVALPAAAAASGIVVFRTRGPSWIEVTDAKGVVAVRKVLEAGESADASGALPLQVTVGRVDQTEVQVRGKAFDLRPVSKDNVARFEVK